MKKRREAVEIENYEKVCRLEGTLKDLETPIQVIQAFMNDYPSLYSAQTKRERSEKCIESVKKINILTFPYFRNLLS